MRNQSLQYAANLRKKQCKGEEEDEEPSGELVPICGERRPASPASSCVHGPVGAEDRGGEMPW
jgi:hypothetical protein